MSTKMNLRKSITLNADIFSEADNNQRGIVSLSANISTNKQTNFNVAITDKELYDVNKTAIRRQIQEFQNEIWKIEDESEAAEENA